MKPLYITAVVTFSGKTALALGVGMKLQSLGHKVGYLKPVSTQPFMLSGKVVDEDADFVRRTLGLDIPAAELSPVVIDEVLFDRVLTGKQDHDYLDDIKSAYERAGQGKDYLLVEGGASLREGHAVGASPVRLINALNMPTLGVVRYRSGVMLVDDVLALRERVGAVDRLLGVVINSVPPEAMDQVRSKVVPFLEKRGVAIFGVLPHQQSLMSLTVRELTQVLNAKVLVPPPHAQGLIENLSVGAMSVESALPHFRRLLNKAVITGGDRADIQAAALETSTTALVLTGNLDPNPTVIRHAEDQGVAVLLVPYTTLETVEKVEAVFGKTRLAHPDKLNRFRATLDDHLNWERLLGALG